MWDWLDKTVVAPVLEWSSDNLIIVATNFVAIAGFVLGLLIIRRVFSEKRSPSNFFAWLLLVVFVPLVGVPLYFLFGGRKSRRISRIKRAVAEQARAQLREPGPALTHVHDIAAHDFSGATTKGNHFELLPDGETAFERLCLEIRRAEHCIHIATYILRNDATGREIARLLEERAREGVAVRLLLDSLGSWNQSRLARYRIRKAGGAVTMFMPVLPLQSQTSSNLRNHRKIAIFDNFRAITGGQNLDLRFMGATPDPERFVDFSVVTQGPAVAYLTRVFIADWAFAAKEPPDKYGELLRYTPEEAGDSTIEVIASGPDVPNDPLWEQILRIIQDFRQQLTIITPYFIPDEVLFRSLIVKAHTGRNIRLVLPLRSNQRLTDIARYHYLDALNEAGVEILFYEPAMLHGKLILADNKVALIGSANIDMRSLFVNFEIALLHYSPRDIARLTRWSDRVIANCISYADAVRGKNLKPPKFFQDFVHLLDPLL